MHPPPSLMVVSWQRLGWSHPPPSLMVVCWQWLGWSHPPLFLMVVSWQWLGFLNYSGTVGHDGHVSGPILHDCGILYVGDRGWRPSPMVVSKLVRVRIRKVSPFILLNFQITTDLGHKNSEREEEGRRVERDGLSHPSNSRFLLNPLGLFTAVWPLFIKLFS